MITMIIYVHDLCSCVFTITSALNEIVTILEVQKESKKLLLWCKNTSEQLKITEPISL